MAPRRLAALGLLAVTALPLSLGCSPGGSDESKTTVSEKPSRPAPSAPAPTPSTRPSALPAPKLDPTAVVAARQGETRGGRTFEFDKGRKGHALVVAVDCQGKGTLEVTVKPIGSEFPLECVDAEVSSTYNQIDIPGVETHGTISVQTTSTVRWSMTIGRETAAIPEGPEDPEATGTPEAE
ncbi:hypothetical protein [Streptomyces sp. NPDC020141]|uniref:hypothetical protein n=1 Tax=Streptomyces sp. NPDC020141 TaxID=3365065 RepID=UPI00379614C9